MTDRDEQATIVTLLQHEPAVPPDRLATYLTQAGVRYRVVALWRERAPTAVEVGAGLVVLGGSMNAYADEVAPWLPEVRRLLAEAVARDVPTLGICLGHQLLAAATGGAVTVADPRGLEAGIHAVRWRSAALDDPVLGGVAAATSDRPGPAGDETGTCRSSTPVPFMHADAVTALPPGAVPLADTSRYSNQAFRLGSALGVQFHPEASPGLLGDWALRRGLPVAAIVAEAHRRDAEVRAAAAAMTTAFAGQVHAGAAAAR